MARRSSPAPAWALPVAAGVALVVAIAVGATMWHRSQESRGERALAAAAVLVQQATAPEAPPDARDKAITALDAVLREHPRFSGAGQAAYQLANLRYAAGAYGPARGAYELALAKGGPASLRALSALGIGYTWEAEKDYAGAANGIRDGPQGDAAQDVPLRGRLLALARVQELAASPPRPRRPTSRGSRRCRTPAVRTTSRHASPR